jgi:hypothetical protein
MAKKTRDEISINASEFTRGVLKEMRSTSRSVKTLDPSFNDECYRRLVAINSWRLDVFSTSLGEDVLSFFLESQNDALLSLVSASVGAWRPALQSLRACMENALFFLYFADHPVELRLWELGQYKIGVSEIIAYLEKHPDLRDSSIAKGALQGLQKEYGTLSRAVHGHRQFQMTKGNTSGVLLFKAQKSDIGAYKTRQAAVLSSLNKLLIAMYHSRLEGTRVPGLRKLIAKMLPPDVLQTIKTEFGVHCVGL